MGEWLKGQRVEAPVLIEKCGDIRPGMLGFYLWVSVKRSMQE